MLKSTAEQPKAEGSDLAVPALCNTEVNYPEPRSMQWELREALVEPSAFT